MCGLSMSVNFVRWLCHKFSDIHPLARGMLLIFLFKLNLYNCMTKLSLKHSVESFLALPIIRKLSKVASQLLQLI